MKACLFCAEQIQDAAIKCRFCGSELPAAGVTAAAPAAPNNVKKASPPKLPNFMQATVKAVFFVGLAGLIVFVGALTKLFYNSERTVVTTKSAAVSAETKAVGKKAYDDAQAPTVKADAPSPSDKCSDPTLLSYPLSCLPKTGVPFEPGAKVGTTIARKSEFFDALTSLVKANGYRCDSITSVITFVFSSGYTLSCNGYHYRYDIADKGGRWVVTVK